MKTISLYIHIPFCESKCYYCDFLSFDNKEKFINNYINNLCKHMNVWKEELKNYKIKTIFIGGGTPSILNIDNLELLFKTLYNNFNINEDVEFTIECNPNSITEKKLITYKKYNVNRLSLGLQAWQNNLLKLMGRIHSQKDYEKAMELIKKYEFDNVNVDIMFGIPNQDIEMLKETLDNVMAKNVTHISCYSLTLEEGTTFYTLEKQKSILMPEEELEREMYHFVCEYLLKYGYHHYEISNFAQKGKECKHNLVYWDCEEYIGLGLGAHSYFNNERFYNTESLNQYKKEAEEENFKKYGSTFIGTIEQYEEFMFLGLRKMAGISINNFKNKFKVDMYQIYGEQLSNMVEDGLLIIENGIVKLTKKGIDLSNMVFSEFILT